MSNVQKLSVLTEDSVETLRVVVSGPYADRLISAPLDEVVSELDLKFVDSDHLVDVDAHLLHAGGSTPDRSLDATNARLLFGALPGMTRANAVDERLWVTLALGQFRGYSLNRWLASGPGAEQYLRNHVFASTARARERNQSIARLWWTAEYCSRFSDETLADALDALYVNSDLPVQFLGRPNLAMVETIAVASLAIFKERFVDEGLEYDRAGIRDFLDELDFLAGRLAWGTLESSRVRQLLEEIFDQTVATQVSAA